MTEAADQATVGRLAQAVDNFKVHYDRLTDYRYGAAIARTKDVQLYREYGEALANAEAMKRKIEAVTGAWENVKQWAGLGALPLIPIAVAIALIATIAAAVASINAFMRRADIAIALKRDPDLSYDEAAKQVDRARPQTDFGKAIDVVQLGLVLGGAFLLYQIFARR